LRIVVVVLRTRRLDLLDEFLGARVFDYRFVVQVLIAGGLDEGRIENLFLDLRVHLERGTDFPGKIGLARGAASLLELREPLRYLAMIRLEQFHRIVGRPLCSGLARAASGSTPACAAVG